MGAISFDDRWQYNGCAVLRLESDVLRVDVLPELGGKIMHLVYKPQNRDWLWQHPSIKPAVLPNSSNYDDNFCGGWDDCFPSVAPGQHKGEFYPDHGEFWTRRFDWQVDRTSDSITLKLQAEGHVTPTRVEKWLTLKQGSPVLSIRHRITHIGEHPFDYMWAQHPALAAVADHELLVPAAKAVIGSPGMGRLAANAAEFNWPHAPGTDGDVVDLSKVPSATGHSGYEMAYLTRLDAGWYAVLDRTTRSGFGLAFDCEVFNNLWLFQSHGGWRGLRVVILEPCTSWPCELAPAAAHGRLRRMQPGESVETQTAAVVFTNRDSVAGIDVNGSVV